MSEEEVDNTDATTIDMYSIALQEKNSGVSTNKNEEDEIAKAFMG